MYQHKTWTNIYVHDMITTMNKSFFLFIFTWPLVFLIGCVHSQVVLFGSPSITQVKSYPPTNPQDVAVYRSTNPISPFTEIGMISYHTGAYDLPTMYDRLRQDSAAYGAQAVIDIKITHETHTEMVYTPACHPETVCDFNGICNTTQVCDNQMIPQEVTTNLITGSMIRAQH